MKVTLKQLEEIAKVSSPIFDSLNQYSIYVDADDLLEHPTSYDEVYDLEKVSVIFKQKVNKLKEDVLPSEFFTIETYNYGMLDIPNINIQGYGYQVNILAAIRKMEELGLIEK